MHFLFSPFGSAGDFHPLLGVAVELRKRGHAVTFVANEYFRDLITSFGLQYEELGTGEGFLASANHPDLWHPYRGFRHIYQSLVGPAVRPQYEAFARHYRPGETVGVTNCFGFGALVAQDQLGMPVLTAHIQPAVIWSGIDPPRLAGQFGPRWLRRMLYAAGERFFVDPVVCPTLNALRAELRLPPVRRITRWWHSRAGVVCLFPEWYCPPKPDWPANLFQTDFPLWDEATDSGLPDEVEAFVAAGDPPVVFTPGSANRFGLGFFQAAVDACQRLGCRGLLLTRFPEQVPARLPPEIAYFPYVPFGQLLPRAAAVVHHGGIGSTAQGLAAGIPQLLMPLAHDQFDNAERVRRLGVGDGIAPARFTGPRVGRRLGQLLSSPTTVVACRDLARNRARRDGGVRTADAFESWADRAAKLELAQP